MKDSGLTTKDEKAAYTWLDSCNNEKYVRDLIYAITWIHPRNEIGDYVENRYNDWLNFHRVDHRRPIWKFDNMLFDVYVAKVDAIDFDYDFHFYHVQEPAPETYNTTAVMHDEYAHNDKRLVMHNKPLGDIKIVGQALYKYDEPNNSFTIKIIR